MSGVVVDTNILLLYVVGLTGPENVERHKRLGAYTRRDFNRVATFLSDKVLFLTPNTVTETNNLLRSGPRTPIVDAGMRQIGALLRRFEEHYVRSLDAADDGLVGVLGITDTVLLKLARLGNLLLTADRDLVAAARQARLRVIDAQEVLAYRA